MKSLPKKKTKKNIYGETLYWNPSLKRWEV